MMPIVSEQGGKGALWDELLSESGHGIGLEILFNHFQTFLSWVIHGDHHNLSW